MEDKTISNRGVAWFLLIFLSIIWGSSYILIKFALFDNDGSERLQPMHLGGLRMTIAAIVFIPFLCIHRKKIEKKHIIYLIIAGVFGNGLPAFLFAYAEIYLSSAVTGMLNSLVPIFAIFIAAIFFGFKVRVNHFIGIAIGVLGAGIIAFYKSEGELSLPILPLLTVVASTLCYAISLNVIKYKLTDLKPIVITSYAFFFAAIPSAVYLALSDFKTSLTENPYAADGLIYVIILALVGTSFAVFLFNYLIKISTPIFASSVTYFIPVCAMIFGFIRNERITVVQVIGMLVLITGVLIINKKNAEKTKN